MTAAREAKRVFILGGAASLGAHQVGAHQVGGMRALEEEGSLRSDLEVEPAFRHGVA